MNLEQSLPLNRTSENHKHYSYTHWQNTEGLALQLGYDSDSIQPYLYALSQHLQATWQKAHDELPQIQCWSFWHDGDDLNDGLEAYEARNLDRADHPFADLFVCVYPEVPLLRAAIDGFFGEKGVKFCAENRTWQDFRGLVLSHE